jgi:hypothetical protein
MNAVLPSESGFYGFRSVPLGKAELGELLSEAKITARYGRQRDR